jgi:hypothetical protein
MKPSKIVAASSLRGSKVTSAPWAFPPTGRGCTEVTTPVTSNGPPFNKRGSSLLLAGASAGARQGQGLPSLVRVAQGWRSTEPAGVVAAVPTGRFRP